MVDLEDVAPLVILPLAAGIVFGVWSLAVNVGTGYDFAEPIWTVGGANISIAFLAAVASIAAIVGTNEIDGSEYEDYEYAMIVFALAAVPLYEFIPAVQDLIAGSDALALFVWLLVAVLSTWIAYTE